MSDDWINAVHTGDAAETLRGMPESSVHMCMTSPPYFGLRDYGVDGQIGLEESLDEYIAELVDVCDAIRHALRPDGSLWLNLGDTYEDKDLQLVPERVALELQDRGWILRNKVTWAKPNPMPQSVKDRLNDTTEKIFHFVLNKDYFYDLDAIREAHQHSRRDTYETSGQYAEKHAVESSGRGGNHPSGKNPGDVFEVTTKPFPDAHFAVYPPELCEKPIKATAPPKVCPECGSPYERKVDREPGEYNYSERGEEVGKGHQASGEQLAPPTAQFDGWTPTCDCDAGVTLEGIVLDPFAGAGTTLMKAKELGRRFVGVELNPEYADMARKRCALDLEDPSNARDAEELGLEAFE